MLKFLRSSRVRARALGSVVLVLGSLSSVLPTRSALAQAPAPAPAGARQLGTVNSVTGSSLTITTDAGQPVAVTVQDGTRIVQLAPGSTDLKAAQAITLTDIGPGDRVLVTGKAGDAAGTFTAARVILMKSGAIAQKRAAEQADWQKRGMGGIVSAVDASAGTLTVSSGAKKTQVQTQPKTIFRRYASDSIKFEDAKPGTVADIQTGDQLEVRGAKSEDGTTIQAEEIVSGSFRNLSGVLTAVNAAAGTISLKDLTTKKMMTVTVTPNSDVRKLPPEVAARFAARERGAAAGAAGPAGAAAPGAGGGPAGAAASSPATGSGRRGPPDDGVAGGPPPGLAGRGGMGGPGGPGGPGGYPGGGGRGGGMGSAGMDLSKMLARLPSGTFADLHTGDAVMIVASQSQQASDKATAVTLLSGVEPILAAAPAGSQGMTLSPWSVGGDAPGGGGAN